MIKKKKECQHLKQAELIIEGNKKIRCVYCKKCKEILEPQNIEVKILKKIKKEIKEMNKKIL